jgi:hypothetical protein
LGRLARQTSGCYRDGSFWEKSMSFRFSKAGPVSL